MGAQYMSCKFRYLKEPSGTNYKYGNLFIHEQYPTWLRVTIAPNDEHVPLMIEIATHWQGPYYVLYVLMLPRRGHSMARYQNPKPLSRKGLAIFAYKFREYFEEDARHHIWFMDSSSKARLVYDNHNLIYSYGNDEEVISLLKGKGFSEGEPQVPAPHEHRFNSESDKSEDEIMVYFDWLRFPLKEYDE
jgi:hypothetical protein